MVDVKGLTKTFAKGVQALRGVSFSACPGGVLGLLGPNGAGKTTTLRILSGYLRPGGGSARICGHDVADDSLAARRQVGYLPEQVALYPEMRISEYLRFRAALRGLPRASRATALAEAIEQVSLGEHQDRIIGQISLGMRQRVGLADALLHRPRVLLLDEPTGGLDPNQRHEVLGLIQSLSQDRIVILSTHVLPEVETVCRDVVIIHRGQVVAAGSPATLAGQAAGGPIEVRCRGDLAALRAALAQVPAVERVEVVDMERERDTDGGAQPGGDVHVLRAVLREAAQGDAGRACEELARAVLGCGELRGLAPARSGLEAVFRWVTQGPPAAPEARP
jgi:ABC-2 type transport system ATP-binding protein